MSSMTGERAVSDVDGYDVTSTHPRNRNGRARPSCQAPALKHIRHSAVLPEPLNIIESTALDDSLTRDRLTNHSAHTGSEPEQDYSPELSSLTQIGLRGPSLGLSKRMILVLGCKPCSRRGPKVGDRVTVAEGTFDRVDVEDNWADPVVLAQVSPSRSALAWEPKGRILVAGHPLVPGLRKSYPGIC